MVAVIPLEDLKELDLRYTGMDRSQVLDSLLREYRDTAFVSRRNGELTGYLMARPSVRGYRMGPWVSAPGDEECPRTLLQMVRDRLLGRKLFVGIPVTNLVGVNLLKRHGFLDGITCQRMVSANSDDHGNPEAIFGITSPAKG